jgi:hypothetical protein
MKRWFILVGLLLLGFSAFAVQSGKTPSQPATPVTTSTAAAQPAKAGWQFSDEERFALRTNAGLARQRVAERRQNPTTNVQAAGAKAQPSANAQQWADSFDGKTHPELFLPHEVFRNFVGMAFEGDSRTRDIVRHGMATGIRKAGLPPDFWERLEPMIAFHVADVRSEKDLLASRSKMSGAAKDRVVKRLELKRTDVCRSRSEALAAARNAFGRERFDRFLYDAVAIHMFHVSDRLPTVEQLRRWEGGCR